MLATYHVTATTVLIVDSVAWLVLMPMLSKQHPSPDANWRKLFFCWTGYNQVRVGRCHQFAAAAVGYHSSCSAAFAMSHGAILD